LKQCGGQFAGPAGWADGHDHCRDPYRHDELDGYRTECECRDSHQGCLPDHLPLAKLEAGAGKRVVAIRPMDHDHAGIDHHFAGGLFFPAGREGDFEIMLDLGALVGTPMAVPLFWGFFIRRTPSWVAFVSIGAAVVPSFLGFNSVGSLRRNGPFR
jgi:hypothetical protein